MLKSMLHAIVTSSTTRGWLAKHRGALAAQIEPELAAILRMDDLTGDSVLNGCSPEEARRKIAISIAVCDQPRPKDVSVTDLNLDGPAGAIPARQYQAAGVPKGAPGVVFFHGGGFVTGDLDTHDGWCGRIAELARVHVIAVDYRLAPEHPFPAGVEDAVAAFRAVAKLADQLGVDPERLAVMGDSAGGNLSAVVARKTRQDAVPPALQVLVYPGTDLTSSHPSHRALGVGWFLTSKMIDWFYEHYSGSSATVAKNPDASPLFAKDLDGLCPALVYVAGLDPLRDEGLAYANRLAEAGVEVTRWDFKHLIHGFAVMTAASPGSAEAVVKIARDLGTALKTLEN